MNQLRPVALLALALGLRCRAASLRPRRPRWRRRTGSGQHGRRHGACHAGCRGPGRRFASCPHPVFDDFLKHFGNEIALQETSTADPLLDSHIDGEAEPEPRKVEEKVPLARSNGR